MGKVDQIRILSTWLNLHGLTNENLLLEAKEHGKKQHF